jgi:UDP-N-acetylglucosamine 2-epimerase
LKGYDAEGISATWRRRAQVVGTEKETIPEEMKTALERPRTLPKTSLYGDDDAAERIVRIIKEDMLS